MLEVIQIFYPTHYNFAAVSVFLLLLTIFLLTKKNIKVALVFLAVFVAMNVFISKKTMGKAWTIEVEKEKSENASDNDVYYQPETMTFSLKNWTITDEKGEVHHWCWVEDLWEVITNTDIVAMIWGENSGKKVRQSSESRLQVTGEE